MALPASGNLELGGNVELEVYGTNTGSRNLTTTRVDGGFSAAGGLSSFYSFNGTPGTQSGVTAVDNFPSGIDCSWTGNSLPDNFDVYRVERSVNGGGYSFYEDTASTSMTTDTGVSVSNTYQYRVRQVTSAGRTGAAAASNVIDYGA